MPSVPGTVIAQGNQSGSSTGHLNFPFTANAAVGDFCVASIISPSGVIPDSTMTDDAGNTWTLVVNKANALAVSCAVFYCTLTNAISGSTPNNANVHLSGNQAQMRWVVKDYGPGVVTASPVDVYDVNSAVTLDVVMGNTPASSQANELAVMCVSVGITVGSTLAAATDPTTGQAWNQVGSIQLSATGNKAGMMADQLVTGGVANGHFTISAPSVGPNSAAIVVLFKLTSAPATPYQWVKADDSWSGFNYVVAADPTTPDRIAVGGDVWPPHTSNSRGDRFTPRARLTTSTGTISTVAEAWSKKNPGLLYVGIGTVTATSTGGRTSVIDLNASAPLDRTPVQIVGAPGFGSSVDLLAGGNQQIRPIGRRILIDFDTASGNEYVYLLSNQGLARGVDSGAGIASAITVLGPSGVNVANAWKAMAMDGAGGLYIASYRTLADYVSLTGSGSQIFYVPSPRTATTVTSALGGAPGVIEDLAYGAGLLWAACGPYGLYTFDGTTWTQRSASTFTGCWLTAVAVHGTTVFVGTENPPSGSFKSLARSRDAGSTWTWVSQPANVSNVQWGTNAIWWLMTDSNFQAFMGADSYDVSLIEIDPNDPSYIYVAGRSGLWISRDGGDNWRPGGPGANGGEVHGSVVGPGASDVAADNQDWDGWTSHDHGQTAVRNESQAPITGNGGGPITVGGHTYQLVNTTAPPTITRDGVSIADDVFNAASNNSSYGDIQVSSDGVVYVSTFSGLLVGYPPGTWAAPVAGTVTIDDTTPNVGDSINGSVSDSSWGGTKPLTYSFEWRVGDSPSGPWAVAPGAGRQSPTYIVDAADAGRYLQCRASGLNAYGVALAVATTQVVGGSSGAPTLTAGDSITVIVEDAPTDPGGGGGVAAYDFTVGTRIDPWLRLDGIELSNAARTLDYLRYGVAGPGVQNVAPSCCGVLHRIDGPIVAFANPVDDPAPWYDSTRPESAQFLGMIVTAFTVESITRRTPVDLPGQFGGSTVGPRQTIGRRINVTATLVSSSKSGGEYGVEWLAQVLGEAGCSTCGVGELEFRRTCPPEDGSDDQLGYWLAEQVGLVQGPDVTLEDLGGNQTDVTWSWVAASPYLFKPVQTCIAASTIDPTDYSDTGCIPFDEWLCAPAGGGRCCTITPPRSGTISPIVTLHSDLGVGEVVIASYAVCPPDLGVDVPVTEMMVSPFAGTVIIDCSQRLATYVSPDGSVVRDGSDLLSVPEGQTLTWIDVDQNCSEARCVCVYMRAPCGGGDQGTVQIDTQFRRR